MTKVQQESGIEIAGLIECDHNRENFHQLDHLIYYLISDYAYPNITRFKLREVFISKFSLLLMDSSSFRGALTVDNPRKRR